MSLLRLLLRRDVSSAALALLALVASHHSHSQAAPAPQAPAPVAQAAPSMPPPTPEQLVIQAASEKEHRREMDVLGIKSLRRGADGDRKSPYAANYDESKADVYPTLPDPLTLRNGKRVTSAKVWWTKRRPEIAEDFDREILGRTPANTPSVKWEIVSTKEEKNGDVPVVTKELIGHVDNAVDPAIK